MKERHLIITLFGDGPNKEYQDHIQEIMEESFDLGLGWMVTGTYHYGQLGGLIQDHIRQSRLIYCDDYCNRTCDDCPADRDLE